MVGPLVWGLFVSTLPSLSLPSPYCVCVQVNKGIDVDVIVAEVRETSHKPDEVGML